MRTFHSSWAYAVVVLNLVAGLWGLLFLRNRERTPKAFWWLIAAGQAALLVQVAFGLVLYQRERPPAIHVFYGFVLVVAAILAFAFRGEGARRTLLVFASVALFIGAVGIRTMLTA
jgi:hypothetical protein